jgi:uncharacterized protein YjbI with pentapeptide repeats
MANELDLALLEQGVTAWNLSRKRNPSTEPHLSEASLAGVALRGVNFRATFLAGANLSSADLTEADLYRAELWQANLIKANLRGANLREARLFRADLAEAELGGADLSNADLFKVNMQGADLTAAKLSGADFLRSDLSGANLTGAELYGARLSWADLRGAKLTGANLNSADLIEADLSEADLQGASLQYAQLTNTNLERANLSDCQIFGLSAWGVRLEGAHQENLVITLPHKPVITVDDIEMGQFIYLMLYNDKIKSIVETITSKVVLILGRFTLERKAVLDEMRESLRKRNYSPILFDFDKPSSRDLTETISILAHMARFIIADISDARSIPQELARVIANLPSVPVQPLLASAAYEYSMFEHFKRYPWVLPVYQYESLDELLRSLEEKVIAPAEAKAREQAPR